MQHDPQMLRGLLTPLLLHLLDQQEDYGYAIVTRLQAAGFTDLNEGTVYPALTRLEKQGHLFSELRRSSSGPARKYYATTAAGRQELARLLAAWEDLTTAARTIFEGEACNSDAN